MLSRINNDIINSLTISELDVLRFVDTNKKQILDWSIQTLSKTTFVSTATIMRLCKKLGYSGFSELKYRLKEEVNALDSFKKTATFSDIVSQNVKSIVDTAGILDEAKVSEIVELMFKPSTRIHFFGKGLTGTIAEYASKELLTGNRANFHYVDTHIAYLAAESMNEDDLLFVCSLSGNTHQIVRMAQIAKGRNAKVVTISSNKKNELSKIGDYNFTVFDEEITGRQFDVASRLPILFVLNIIITSYIDKLR